MMDRAAHIRSMRDSGMTWPRIAEELGVSMETAYRYANEQYRARRIAVAAAARRGRTGHRSIKPEAEDVAARLAEIPPDTRSLTGVTFGDPVFERSALYRKMKGQQA